eukprot:9352897-Pyramimonas_sp.AAC.1
MAPLSAPAWHRARRAPLRSTRATAMPGVILGVRGRWGSCRAIVSCWAARASSSLRPSQISAQCNRA